MFLVVVGLLLPAMLKQTPLWCVWVVWCGLLFVNCIVDASILLDCRIKYWAALLGGVGVWCGGLPRM